MKMYNKFVSVDVEWAKLTEQLTLFQRKLVPICGDGKCFITAVRTYLANDYLIQMPEEQEDISILNEIYNKLGQYTRFHEGTQQGDYTGCREILQDPKTYVWKRYNECHSLCCSKCLRNKFCHLPKYWRKGSHHCHPTVPRLQQTGQST